MPNQYPGYDLGRTKERLKGTAWERLLPVFAHVKMATLTQIVDWTGLDAQKVRRDLKTMCGVVEAGAGGEARAVLARDARALAWRAWVERGEAVYRLGKLGWALLREMGVLQGEVTESKETRRRAMSQSLCILDVAREAARNELEYRVERRLATASSGGGAWVKPDLAWVERGTGGEACWHLVEVEQTADEGNEGRIRDRLAKWCAFFDAGGGQVANSEIVMVFNVAYSALPETLRTWEAMLAESESAYGRPLTFTVRYKLLETFLDEPEWAGSGYPALRPAAPQAEGAEAEPAATRVDALDTLRLDTDLGGLAGVALRVYRASRTGEDTPAAKYGIPVASLREYRRWLDVPAQWELRRELERQYGVLQTRMGTLQASVLIDRAARLILRHFGIDRPDWTKDASFRWAGMPPTTHAHEALYGEYRVQVVVGALFQDMQRWGLVDGVHVSELEKALTFFLTAPFAYPDELRLAQAKQKKKRRADTETEK